MIMENKVAIVTQSYINDFKECKLLCESMDKFAPDIDHYIFVNDEDIEMFMCLQYGKHVVLKKSLVLPWFLIRVPWKMMGHHFHVSPLTIPVREWIIQQICKLGVFEVIGKEYEAVFNIDSETVFMKPLDLKMWKKNGKYFMYRVKNVNEPSHDDYCHAAVKLLNWQGTYEDISFYNYMNTPVCFVRENTEKLLREIAKNYWMHSWKLALCNTYRFSEYYTYAIYSDWILNMNNHFVIDYKIFPQVDITSCSNRADFDDKIAKVLEDEHSLGVWLNKKQRKYLNEKYFDFDTMCSVIREYWKKYN